MGLSVPHGIIVCGLLPQLFVIMCCRPLWFELPYKHIISCKISFSYKPWFLQ